jgi:O-antigen/teichoic acid export membrane protein
MPSTDETESLLAVPNGVTPAGEFAGAASSSRSLRSAAVYAFGFTVQRVIGLLMLPLYTRALSPADYGALGVLLSASVALGLLFSAALETWITRTDVRLADDPRRREEHLDSVWRFLIVYPIGASIVIGAIAWPIFADSRPVGSVEVALTLLATAVNVAATTLPLAVLRARQDLRGFLSVALAVALLTPALTVLFVVVLDQGIRGWFLAGVVAGAATFCVAWVVVPWRPKGHLRWSIVWPALVFSAPLVPHVFSHWALQLADRGVIAGMVSGPDLGLYTLAGVMAGTVMMLFIALNQGFAPSYARAGTRDSQEGGLAQVAVVQITAVVGIALTGALFGPPLVELLTPAEYHGAAALIPWLVLGYSFAGLYFIPMNGATLAVGRTRYAWVATAASAALNIGLLLLFVPEHGVRAAAIASAVGYLALLVLATAWAHARPNPVQYDWRRILPTIAAGAIAYAGAQMTATGSLAGEIAFHVVWLVAFLGTVVAFVFRTTAVQLAQRARVAWRPR